MADERRPGAAIAAAARPVAVVAAVAAGCLALLVGLAALAGADPERAVIAFWSNALGSWYALSSATLVRAVPLVLTGLAVALAFRAGIFNIGAEGQLLAGATAAAAVGLAAAPLAAAAPWIAVAAGAVAGAAWASIPALLRARYGVLEVITTILMNFLALHAVGWLVRGPLQEPLGIYPQSATLPEEARLPIIAPGSRLHAGVVIAGLAAVALWLALRHSAAGFRVRVVGANPGAAAAAGRIDVARTTVRAFLVSGALAGVAGAVELTGVTGALYENLSPGYGYTAIAVALLARLHPLAVAAAAVGFGALEAGAAGMQRDAAVPATVAWIVQAMLVIAVLVATRVRLGRGALVGATT